MLLSGCRWLNVDPHVPANHRNRHDRGSFAPNVSRISRAQIRRLARYLATSANRFMNARLFKEWGGANAPIESPRSSARRTYSTAFPIANAISWTAVAPDSRMWYPHTEI